MASGRTSSAGRSAPQRSPVTCVSISTRRVRFWLMCPGGAGARAEPSRSSSASAAVRCGPAERQFQQRSKPVVLQPAQSIVPMPRRHRLAERPRSCTSCPPLSRRRRVAVVARSVARASDRRSGRRHGASCSTRCSASGRSGYEPSAHGGTASPRRASRSWWIDARCGAAGHRRRNHRRGIANSLAGARLRWPAAPRDARHRPHCSSARTPRPRAAPVTRSSRAPMRRQIEVRRGCERLTSTSRRWRASSKRAWKRCSAWRAKRCARRRRSASATASCCRAAGRVCAAPSSSPNRCSRRRRAWRRRTKVRAGARQSAIRPAAPRWV